MLLRSLTLSLTLSLSGLPALASISSFDCISQDDKVFFKATSDGKAIQRVDIFERNERDPQIPRLDPLPANPFRFSENAPQDQQETELMNAIANSSVTSSSLSLALTIEGQEGALNLQGSPLSDSKAGPQEWLARGFYKEEEKGFDCTLMM